MRLGAVAGLVRAAGFGVFVLGTLAACAGRDGGEHGVDSWAAPDAVEAPDAPDAAGPDAAAPDAAAPDAPLPGRDVPDPSGDAAPDGPPCPFDPAGPARVSRWGLFETVAAFDHGERNPFDPAAVDLRAELVGPDGAIFEAIAFRHAPYERALVDGLERLTPAGPADWRARFTPPVEGPWTWRWRAAVDGGPACVTPWRALTVGPSAPGRHGFLRVSARDDRFLAFDDGTPYLAIGENMGWADGRGTFAYDDWLGKLAAAGGTWVRVWMASWGFALEWTARDAEGALTGSSLGDYTARLDRAWQLDRVLAAADALGIQVMLCLQNHGAFSTQHNPEWADNPYNAANGGPLAAPTAFFEDARSRELFARRLRYVVARWGHAPNLLAWELWNEVDLTSQYDKEILAAWHAEMASVLRALDPHDHLITTSTTSFGAALGLDAALFDLPTVDLAQLHLYGGSFGPAPDFVTQLPAHVERLRRHGKPVLIAEAGVDARGPAETLAADPDFTGTRDILWMGVLAGSAGTGMGWWWDNLIDPADAYPLFAAVARAADGIAWDAEGFTAHQGLAGPPPGDGVRVAALAGRTVVLLRCKNAADRWSTGGDPSEVAGFDLDLRALVPALAAGAWEAAWIDPQQATVSAAAPLLVPPDGPALLPVPAFRRDVVARLRRGDL
jgi:hypothetical protein